MNAFEIQGKVGGTTVLPMNRLNQVAVIANCSAVESSGNDMFDARPHPSPLPRGEGETVAAFIENMCRGLVDGFVHRWYGSETEIFRVFCGS